MKKTPLQKVNDEFGSKEKLADKLIPLLDRPEDEDADTFAKRIRTASNKQLLRLWAAEQAVKERFGSRDKLVDAIVRGKFDGKDNADYRAKIAPYSKSRLLDLHRQVTGNRK